MKPAAAKRKAAFADRVLDWFDRHGRHDLPWQQPRTPYRVWLSEVMLQQTQVVTVIPYFERFTARFPDWQSLAAASLDEVLERWAGLGYYARGRNLHRAAQMIVDQYGGEVPADFEAVNALPGIGRSTAGAVLAQAFGQRHAILDGNVKRVLARHAGVHGWPGEPAVAAQLWLAAEARLPTARLADYTQAMMDLGATVCTTRTPACLLCPIGSDCRAFINGNIAQLPGSRPRRERPLRSAKLLLIEIESDRYLFERRPPAGIWGGLWCLPMLDANEDWRAITAARYGLNVEWIESDPIFRHSFTHFDLDLEPVRLRVLGELAAVAEQVDRRWIKIATEGLPGVPTPIRKLLFSRL